MAKRITVNPGTRRISILSDNPAYAPFENVDRQSFQIVGRVLWIGRKV
jgi:phage repressor protein C with HTH and peptisase S24 domain